MRFNQRYSAYADVETLIAILEILAHEEADLSVVEPRHLFGMIAKTLDDMLEAAVDGKEHVKKAAECERLQAENAGLRDSLARAENEIKIIRASR